MAEDFDYVTMKIPTIYLLDCTLNDCHLILKSVDQVLVIVDISFPGVNVPFRFYIHYGLLLHFFQIIVRLLMGCICLATIFLSCIIIIAIGQTIGTICFLNFIAILFMTYG
jgi:hypothetical protein